jgi:tRNA dimethylallyltransferase
LKESVIFLLGPTGVGKTDVGIQLARHLKGEIVSADSMQLYRGMDIGTAKPSIQERDEIPHHLFDQLDIHEHCDVALFRKLAEKAVLEIWTRGAMPIIVGGSGMYVRSLTQGLFEGPGRDSELRKELEDWPLEKLRDEISKVDPDSAKKIEKNDRKRMIRALEFYQLTQRPISELQTQWKAESKGDFLGKPRTIFGLMRPRDELYRRCDLRVEKMFKQGWVGEVELLLKKGLREAPTACKAIGYPDIMGHLEGKSTLEKTVECVKQKTRQFVKRQLTWFRREPDIKWVNIEKDEKPSEIARKIEALSLNPS